MELNPADIRRFRLRNFRNPLYSTDIACTAYPNRREFGRSSQEHIYFLLFFTNIDKKT